MADEIEVVWEEPPAPPNRATMYDGALKEVKENPGKWARLRVFDGTSSAYTARKMIAKKLDGEHGWEIKASRLPGQEKSAVWVKYEPTVRRVS